MYGLYALGDVQRLAPAPVVAHQAGIRHHSKFATSRGTAFDTRPSAYLADALTLLSLLLAIVLLDAGIA